MGRLKPKGMLPLFFYLSPGFGPVGSHYMKDNQRFQL